MAKITKKYCEGRKSPYQLFWIEDGVRHSRFFEAEEAREDFLRLNGHLDKRSFGAFWGIDENTILDFLHREAAFSGQIYCGVLCAKKTRRRAARFLKDPKSAPPRGFEPLFPE